MACDDIVLTTETYLPVMLIAAIGQFAFDFHRNDRQTMTFLDESIQNTSHSFLILSLGSSQSRY
jgi:hypothetical protein